MQVLRAMQAGLLLSTASALCGGAGTHGWTDGQTDRPLAPTRGAGIGSGLPPRAAPTWYCPGSGNKWVNKR